MESENVLKYMQETGYRTLEEIQAQFSKENKEVLNALIEFLVSKNKIRKISFQAPTQIKILYYVTSKE